MIRRTLLTLAVLALALPAALATAAPDATKAKAKDIPQSKDIPPKDIPMIDYEKYALANGLEVILVQDRRLPMVAVNLWYHVGPANEAAGRTGFAHLFEHMMFQKSKHVPEDSFFKMLEGAGSSEINGTTDFDRTNYFETLPSNQLELALWLESDRMGYLLDTLDAVSLANQQDVVRNERRQSVENRPYGMVEEALYHELYPNKHPYYASVIGSHADIQAANLEDVRKFFEMYYSPNNASLAIVGDIDVAATKKLVEKYFGSLKRGPAVPKPDVKLAPLAGEKRTVVKDRIELPRVYIAWHTPNVFTKEDALMTIAGRILGSGKASRLYKKLVYEKQIAQDVDATQESLALGSNLTIRITARPGHTAEELERAVDEEVALFLDKGPTAQEVARAQNLVETGILRGLETLGGFGGLADRLNMYNHYLGNPGYLAEDLARYRAATPESVRNIARQYFKKDARVVVHGVPGTPELGAPVATPPAPAAAAAKGAPGINADEAWRNEPPKGSTYVAAKLPTPQVFTLANGMTVMLDERPKSSMVAANVVLRTGSEANPLDRSGLANFTAAMIDEGTKTRDALVIADEVAQLGAQLSTWSSADGSFAGTVALAKNFPAAFAVLADVVLNPTFPQEEIERQRASRMATLVQQRDNPGAVASKTLSAALYGDKHPYGFAEIGTEEAIKATGREDMLRFWQRHYSPRNAAVVVAGNITRAEIEALASKAFGGWKTASENRPAMSEPQTTAARLVLVDKPGAQQTQVRVGQIAVSRSDPDYDELEVLGAALGGLFSSRINMNLRERNGYAYGAFGGFAYRRAPGFFIVASGVRTDVTAPAVTEIINEVRSVFTRPVDGDELRIAKDSIVRSLPGLFETSDRAANAYSEIFLFGLPADYYTALPGRVDAVTSAHVTAAAKKHIVPEKLVVIAVGDKAKIEPELVKLNLGSMEVRNTDGMRIAAAPAPAPAAAGTTR